MSWFVSQFWRQQIDWEAMKNLFSYNLIWMLFSFFFYSLVYSKQWMIHNSRIKANEEENSILFNLPKPNSQINLQILNSSHGKFIIHHTNSSEECTFNYFQHPYSNQISGSCITNFKKTFLILYNKDKLFSVSDISTNPPTIFSINVKPSFFQTHILPNLSFVFFPAFCVVITFFIAKSIGEYFHLLPHQVS